MNKSDSIKNLSLNDLMIRDLSECLFLSETLNKSAFDIKPIFISNNLKTGFKERKYDFRHNQFKIKYEAVRLILLDEAILIV